MWGDRVHDSKLSAGIIVLLTIAYGFTVGVLAMQDSGAVSTFASIGGMVLGLLWVARWMVAKHT